MDFYRIAELFTSIVVAFIMAGYLKPFFDKRTKLYSKKKLMEQIKKDEFVHLMLSDILKKYKSDRIYVWQFHNGDSFYTSSSMQKITITYEEVIEGLSRKSYENKNLLITNYSTYIKTIMTEGVFYSKVEKIKNLSIKLISQNNGVKSHCALPLFDKDKQLVALVCMDWVFNDVDESLLLESGNFNDKFKEDFNNSIKSITNYL